MIFRIAYDLQGVVQGIGLRPLLFRLSQEYHLTGTVQNTAQSVSLIWQGKKQNIHDAFFRLKEKISQFGPFDFQTKELSPLNETRFEILPSTGNGTLQNIISPDLATCEDCLAELFDPHNRRFQYPFITCATCGPRLSISNQLPFDRHQTTMTDFPLCSLCQAEYDDPSNRRFHAQTISCPNCGPHYSHSLNILCQMIQCEKIIALKGIGGFHLLALASADKTIALLRKRKNRTEKPFAIMVKDLEQAKILCEVSAEEEKALISPASPIVLLKRKENLTPWISKLVAPHHHRLGILLPYSPIHHLLLQKINQPIIFTSGNMSDEPLCFTNEDAQKTLCDIADIVITHDRKIIHALDDSIVQKIGEKIQVLRRSRGLIPFILKSPHNHCAKIGLGGHLKNTLALSHQGQIYLSPYLGDLTHKKTLDKFNQELKSFKEIAPSATLIGDPHPDYATPKAQTIVDHHHAHIYAVIAEYQLSLPLLGFAWDGLGMSCDDSLLGCESYSVEKGKIQHLATLRSIPLIGLERAIREPKRIAYALLQCLKSLHSEFKVHFSQSEDLLFNHMIENKLRCPPCSSMGRLFDGVAYLLGGPAKTSFEAQAALYLEQLAETGNEKQNVYPVIWHSDQHARLVIDWQPMISFILKDLHNNVEKSTIAYRFHLWCAQVILKLSVCYKLKTIVLSGGVFQNKLLTELSAQCLRAKGFEVYFGLNIPPNDSGLSIGQVAACV